MKSSSKLRLGGLLLAALFVFVLWGASGTSTEKGSTVLAQHEVTLYKSPLCGCCTNYVGYLRKKGITVNVIDTDDVDQIKMDNGIPKELWSCHTTLIGGYSVEGHIPTEAMEKLLTEKPDILGIGLPAMPSGSPGMPGGKTGPFEIKQFMSDGEHTLFMNL
ncbi:hypothetical protein CO046_02590 [Candidatus Peregrinibacteria bacterium CG_4_9_14_0_2_um_filter_53_11]|nr:MAG: hypothetical protein CO046_02590 [Candidatus Peregrinibacteria bacterium CG_4_9_14_0_2_um_filter_53_11]